MISGTGLVLVLIVASLLFALLWRFENAIEGEAADESGADHEDRIVTQTAAAQRLRREAEETSDPTERARLIRFADEADGTAEKIRQGILSDE